MRRIAPTSSRFSRTRLLLTGKPRRSVRNDPAVVKDPHSARRGRRRSLILLRKTGGMGGIGRSAFAYAMGFLISSSTSIGVFLTTQAISPAPVLDADRI